MKPDDMCNLRRASLKLENVDAPDLAVAVDNAIARIDALEAELRRLRAEGLEPIREGNRLLAQSLGEIGTTPTDEHNET